MPTPLAPPVDPSITDAGIAVIPILGPLVSRGDWMTGLLGALEYGEIGATIESAAQDPSVRGILLEVDSPGGEVGGLFDLVERIRALKESSDKPLWAVASESALSAAYAIASVADRFYVTRTGEVGSVGVIAVHIDESGADAMAGLKWTLIRAGERKTDGNPHEPLTPRAHADVQADVDRLYRQLVDLVAANRGAAPESVRATEAGIYRGARAVDTGLADGIGTVDQMIAELAAVVEPKQIRAGPRSATRNLSTQPLKRTSAMTDPDIETCDLPVEEDEDSREAETPNEQPVQPPVAASTPEPSSTAVVDASPSGAGEDACPPGSAESASAIGERLRAEYGEIAAIAAQAARLGVGIDAADAMRRGLKPDALRRSVLDSLATRSEAADVVAASTAPVASGESPIVKRARERASTRP